MLAIERSLDQAPGGCQVVTPDFRGVAHRTLAGSCRSGCCIAEFVAAPGAGVRRLGCGRHAVVNKCRCRPKPAAPIPPPLQQPAFAPAATLQIPLRIVSEHSVEETWRGQPLTLRRSNATVRGVGTTEALTITLGASELLSVHTSRAKTGFVEVNVTYGNAFRGLKRAAFYSRDGKVLEGDMDGRRIRPFIAGADPNSLRFADGGSPPATEVSPDIKQAIQSIFEKEKELAARGGGGTAPQTPPRPPGPSPPPGPPDPPDSADHGHGSNPAASGGCVGCKAVCYTAAGTCGYGAAAAAAGCIIFYVACLAGGLAGCAVASIFCIAACHATGFPCCPTACGDVACCDGDETCLDPNPGVCCSKGLIACAANSCCQPSDTCINATGECCSKDQIVCNHVCCKPGEVCKDGVICCPPKQDVCGGVCCGINALCNEKTGKCCPSQLLCGGVCCDELSRCVDSGKSLCCSFAVKDCGDKCCQPGEVCIDDKCCSNACGSECCKSNQLCCGGICCPSGQTCLDAKAQKCGGCGAGLVGCIPDPPGPGICCPNGVVACCYGKCCKPGDVCCGGPGTTFGCHASFSDCLA